MAVGAGGVTGSTECTFAPTINARSSRMLEDSTDLPADFGARQAHFDRQRRMRLGAAAALQATPPPHVARRPCGCAGPPPRRLCVGSASSLAELSFCTRVFFCRPGFGIFNNASICTNHVTRAFQSRASIVELAEQSWRQHIKV